MKEERRMTKDVVRKMRDEGRKMEDVYSVRQRGQ